VRGKINHPGRAQQIIDFSGLRYGNITPTDLDGLIEYQDEAYILIEIKYLDALVPYGQNLALERLTDDLERSGKPTLCIVATHDVSRTKDVVNGASAKVRKFRLKGGWCQYAPELGITVKDLSDAFIRDTSVSPMALEFSLLR